MRVPTRPRSTGLQFNITPLIDVVFLLIIFFLVSTHFVRSETSEPIELPSATQGDSDVEQSARLVLTVTQDGRFVVGDKTVSLEEVERRIQEGLVQHGEAFQVHLRGDRRVAYGKVEPILLKTAQAGIKRLRIVVEGR